MKWNEIYRRDQECLLFVINLDQIIFETSITFHSECLVSYSTKKLTRVRLVINYSPKYNEKLF